MRSPGPPGRRRPRGGTGAAYWTARIKRDHPEVFAGLRAGRYTSVYEAALACGMATPQCVCRLTAESFAQQAHKRLPAEAIARLVEYLQHPERLPPAAARGPRATKARGLAA
jgi:hypothetical protein